MQTYIAMGFDKKHAERAVEYYGSDIEAGSNWLLRRKLMGTIPKEFLTTRKVFIGSSVMYKGCSGYVREYNPTTHLIRIQSWPTPGEFWTSLSDPFIRWVKIRHKKKMQKWIPEWRRRLFRIQLPTTVFPQSVRNNLRNASYQQRLEIIGHRYPQFWWGENAMPNFERATHVWKALMRFHNVYRREPIEPFLNLTASTEAYVKRQIVSKFRCWADLCDKSYSDVMQALNVIPRSPDSIVELFRGSIIPEDEIRQTYVYYNLPSVYIKNMQRKWYEACIPMLIIRIGTPKNSKCNVSLYVHADTWRNMRFITDKMKLNQHFLYFRQIIEYKKGIVQQPIFRNNFQETIVEAKPPEQLADTRLLPDHLLDHQIPAVQWMVWRETNNPLSAWGWTKQWETHGTECWTSLFGHISKVPPKLNVHGGILCQNVGAGKTVEIIAMMSVNQFVTHGPTLIVCPTSMVGIWKKEIEKWAPNFSVSVNIRKEADVYVASYGTICRDGRNHDSRFASKSFGRIVLDEAHCLGYEVSATARAVYALRANKKWCVTATPKAKLHTLGSLYHFLEIPPFCTQYSIQTNSPYSLFRGWMEQSKYGGIFNTMRQLQREICYSDNFTTERAIVESVQEVDSADIDLYKEFVHQCYIRHRMHHSSNMSMLNVLHWATYAANHPSHVPLFRFGEVIIDENFQKTFEGYLESLGTTSYDENVREYIQSIQNGNELCPICQSIVDRPVITPCKHIFCKECVTQWFRRKPACPVCRAGCTSNNLEELVEVLDEQESGDFTVITSVTGVKIKVKNDVKTRYEACQRKTSAKIIHLLDNVEQSSEKFVVFSSSAQMLHDMRSEMEKRNIEYSRIDGSMSAARRQRECAKFESDAKVFIMSLKSANCGITLTSSSTVVFLEPCMSPPLKKQAIGRVNRIGQKENIKVITYATRGTIDISASTMHTLPNYQWIRENITTN